jgi:hypothetical protein
LDDPADVGVADAGSPDISALSVAGVDRLNGWDVAVWFDVLTIPGTEGSNEFYREMEQWIVSRFSGAAGRVMPEWSKGWAYTEADGPWNDETFLADTRAAFTNGRDPGHGWDDAMATLQKYDAARLFRSPLLQRLCQLGPSDGPADED